MAILDNRNRNTGINDDNRFDFFVTPDYLDNLQDNLSYSVTQYLHPESPDSFIEDYGRPTHTLYGKRAWKSGRGYLVIREDGIVFLITPIETRPDDRGPGSSDPESGGGSSGDERPPRTEPIGAGKVFSRFDSNDIIPNQQEYVTRALWSNNVGNLTSFYTSSFQSDKQKEYYYEIFNEDIEITGSACEIEPQFSVAYGHRFGSGSNEDDSGALFMNTPTRAIYGQYRLLCLNSDEDAFVIDGETVDSLYVININRARMLEHVDEGSIELNLQALTGGGSDVAGSEDVTRLIDDSTINSATLKQSGEVYNMVSGSLEDGVHNPQDPIIFGQLFKRKGIIVLNGDMLDDHCNFETELGQEVDGDNAHKLFLSIKGAAEYDDGTNTPLGFIGRGSEKVKSIHYFVRAKNLDYNFSNNPSFIDGPDGDLRHGDMHRDPKTYITTVGLYNKNKELIAVAKLSKPVRKSFTEEALIKVRLDF